MSGVDQTSYFILPIIIAARITEHDGISRDMVTRIQHLGELALPDVPMTIRNMRLSHVLESVVSASGGMIRRKWFSRPGER